MIICLSDDQIINQSLTFVDIKETVIHLENDTVTQRNIIYIVIFASTQQIIHILYGVCYHGYRCTWRRPEVTF